MAERRKSYAEQLKDVRWQRKRLELQEARGWKCERCEASGNDQLHIHHRFYSRSLMAWEYPPWGYQALCAACHEAVQAKLESIHESVAVALDYGIQEDHLLGYIHGSVMRSHPTFHKKSTSWTTSYLQGLSDALCVPMGVLLKLVAEVGFVTAMHAWDYPFHGQDCCLWGC